MGFKRSKGSIPPVGGAIEWKDILSGVKLFIMVGIFLIMTTIIQLGI
jgi:hypothetical protein